VVQHHTVLLEESRFRMRASALLRYLLVPLNPSAVAAILSLAVALTIAEHSGVLGITLFFGTSLLLVCYGFALLDHVLDGRSHPLVLSIDVRSAFAGRSIGTLFVVFLFYYATYRLQPLVNPYAIVFLRLLLVAVLPAMVGVMALTGRFADALNPLEVFRTIARIPLGYAALVFLLAVLWGVPLWMVHRSTFSFGVLWQAESFLPGGLLAVIGLRGLLIGLLGQIVFTYLWLASFACIGGLLYERRWDLSHQPAESPERKAERVTSQLEQRRDWIMDRLYAELRGGAFANAVASVRQLLAEASQPIEECRWLYTHAARLEDQRLANYLAHLLLSMLLNHRATGEALEVTRQRLDVSRDFRPQTSAQLLRLVELACAAGDRPTARRLLVDLDRHYGNDPLLPRLAQLQGELQR
jgi:hypothetical protein